MIQFISMYYLSNSAKKSFLMTLWGGLLISFLLHADEILRTMSDLSSSPLVLIFLLMNWVPFLFLAFLLRSKMQRFIPAVDPLVAHYIAEGRFDSNRFADVLENFDPSEYKARRLGLSLAIATVSVISIAFHIYMRTNAGMRGKLTILSTGAFLSSTGISLFLFIATYPLYALGWASYKFFRTYLM